MYFEDPKNIQLAKRKPVKLGPSSRTVARARALESIPVGKAAKCVEKELFGDLKDLTRVMTMIRRIKRAGLLKPSSEFKVKRDANGTRWVFRIS